VAVPLSAQQWIDANERGRKQMDIIFVNIHDQNQHSQQWTSRQVQHRSTKFWYQRRTSNLLWDLYFFSSQRAFRCLPLDINPLFLLRATILRQGCRAPIAISQMPVQSPTSQKAIPQWTATPVGIRSGRRHQALSMFPLALLGTWIENRRKGDGLWTLV
jgi:hypothetical protein